MKTDRLFRILYSFMGKGTMTAPQLASLLEVSVRTVYRDIETLSMAGVPIYAMPGRNGGISLLPGHTVDKALLSDEEQDQLLFALQSLQVTDMQADTLLEKLDAVFQKQGTNWMEIDFSRWGHKREDQEKFEYLKQAILQKHIVHIGYYGTSGAMTERNIKPFRLVYKDRHWYLYAFCLKADDFRLFKISRIRDLQMTATRFIDDFKNVPPVGGGQDS